LAKKRTLKRSGNTAQKAAVNRAKKTLKKSASKTASNTRKQIENTKRTLKKAVAQGRKNQERNESQYIENLLGEDFESLSQARAALKREVTTVKKKVSKSLPKQLKKFTPKEVKKQVLKTAKKAVTETVKQAVRIVSPVKLSQPHIDVSPRQKSYTLRELKDGDRRAMFAYLEDRMNANALDKALLKKGETWAAQIPYKYRGMDGKVHEGYSSTFEVYQSAYALFRRLSAYGAKREKKATKTSEWLNQIKIVKFGGTTGEWKKKKGAETKKQNERRKKVSKKLKSKGGKK
jgi:hypothetical protein